jgi:Flp pilus assembly pilin Flp
MSILSCVGVGLWVRARSFHSQCEGQDVIEYALMAALVATGVVSMSPAVASAFVDMLSKVNSVVVVAGAN